MILAKKEQGPGSVNDAIGPLVPSRGRPWHHWQAHPSWPRCPSLELPHTGQTSPPDHLGHRKAPLRSCAYPVLSQQQPRGHLAGSTLRADAVHSAQASNPWVTHSKSPSWKKAERGQPECQPHGSYPVSGTWKPEHPMQWPLCLESTSKTISLFSLCYCQEILRFISKPSLQM